VNDEAVTHCRQVWNIAGDYLKSDKNSRQLQQNLSCRYSSHSTVLSSRFLVLSTCLLLLVDAEIDKNVKIASGISIILAHSARYPALCPFFLDKV